MSINKLLYKLKEESGKSFIDLSNETGISKRTLETTIKNRDDVSVPNYENVEKVLKALDYEIKIVKKGE